ncbi:hypothetical protein F8568_038085 [Actinomadura sp. LD22]|uniref:Uncharacterized protein n=1 Tax=Actinomadura physcomitrii TaxID=2650748 RepID=A0A6I4MKD8_9ACTN|nr:hypothetical protein [Actinomadura physcomitrii]
MAALVVRLSLGNLHALVPVALVYGTLTVLGLAAVPVNLDGQALIINGELRPDAPRPGLVVTGLAVAGVLLAAHLVMVAMVVVVMAGVLLGRPAPVGGAMRQALHGTGPIMILLTLACFVVGVLSFLLALTPVVTHPWLYVTLTATLLGVFTCWLLFTVPIVVLEGAGPFRALSRLRDLARYRWPQIFWHGMVPAVLAPLTLELVCIWATSRFAGIERSVAEAALGIITAVLTVVVQGAALAVVTLSPEYPLYVRLNVPSELEPRPMDLDAVAARLHSGTTPRRRRPGRAVSLAALVPLMLAAPGAMYGAYLHANPLSLPKVTIRNLPDAGFTYDLVSVNGNRAAVVVASDKYLSDAKIDVCKDAECGHASTLPYPYPGFGEPRSAALPDGTIALAQSIPSERAKRKMGSDNDRPVPMEIRLTRCTSERCPNDFRQSPVIAEGRNFPERPYFPAFDIMSAGRGIMAVVMFDATSSGSSGVRSQALQIVRCDDFDCQGPRLLVTDRVVAGYGPTREEKDRRVAIAEGARGRPVAVFENRATHAMTLVSCDDADCRQHVTRQLARPVPYARDTYLETEGVDVVVPPDDRPIIMHGDAATGNLQLLRCRTPDCAASDAVSVAGPYYTAEGDKWGPEWGLALGSDGLPLIATYEHDRGRAVLIACKNADCSRRGKVTLSDDLRIRGWNTLDDLQLKVDTKGRPYLLLSIRGPERWEARLLTCHEPKCGAA